MYIPENFLNFYKLSIPVGIALHRRILHDEMINKFRNLTIVSAEMGKTLYYAQFGHLTV